MSTDLMYGEWVSLAILKPVGGGGRGSLEGYSIDVRGLGLFNKNVIGLDWCSTRRWAGGGGGSE